MGASSRVRLVAATLKRKGPYTGDWMSTPSPGSVRARMASLMPVTTQGIMVSQSASMVRSWRRCQKSISAWWSSLSTPV